MKKQFKTLTVLLAALTLGLTSCSKDDSDSTGGGETGKKASLQIKVRTSSTSASGTRAAGNATASPTGKEDVLAGDVYVFVFKDDGTYEYAAKHTLDVGTKKTPAFTITEGTKYFYVFSDPNDVTTLSTLVNNTSLNRTGLETTLLTEASFSSPTYLAAADATNGFVNGTLWGVKRSVDSDTGSVDLEIGRMVAKITMAPQAADFHTKTDPDTNEKIHKMSGTWSDFKYSIGSVALRTNYVGQYDETKSAPPVTGHGAVTSAVHDEPYNSTAFADYPLTDYNDLVEPTAANYFYVNENTTSRQVSAPYTEGNLFYGNTTYVRFSAVYTPADDDYCDPTDINNTGATFKNADGVSYYTAVVGGKVYVFGTSPTVTIDNGTEIKFYNKGINLFRFPVRDRFESGLENQCRVLRNHWYQVSVNSINQFGTPTGTGPNPPIPPVPPITPIEEEIDLDVEVKVLQWSKVEQGEDL